MEGHIETFRQCCKALLTGINVTEANSWLTALTQDKTVCLPLCIAVIETAEVLSDDSVFLASKIIHNTIRESRYTISIGVDYVQVLMYALFHKEIRSQCTPSVITAHRQLCLCITAALLTYTSHSASILEFVQHLSQLAHQSQDNFLKVLRIIEEIPTEMVGITIILGESQKNLILLLRSLRNVLLSSLECSAVKYCGNLVHLLNQTDENKIFEDLFTNDNRIYNGLISEIFRSTAVVRAMHAWSTFSSISLSDLNTCLNEHNANSHGIIDNKIFDSDSDSNSLLSFKFIILTPTQCQEFLNKNYFELFTFQIRLIIKFQSIINKKLIGLGVSVGNGTRNGSGTGVWTGTGTGTGVSVPVSCLHTLSKNLLEYLVLCSNILNEWLLVPYLNKTIEFTNNESQFIIQQQQQQHTIIIYKSVYTIFLLIVELWDLIVKCNGHNIGIAQWREQLDIISSDHTARTNDNENSSYSSSEHIFLEALEVSGIVPIGVQYLGSEPLITALIELTITFTEKHTAVLYDTNYVYVASRNIEKQFPFLSLDITELFENNPCELFFSCVLCCLSVDKSLAIGAIEAVTYLERSFPKNIFGSFLEILISPILRILMIQNCYDSLGLNTKLELQFLPNKINNNFIIENISQNNWLDFGFYYGDIGHYFSGDMEEKLESSLSFRKESYFTTQMIYSNWKNGYKIWNMLLLFCNNEIKRLLSAKNIYCNKNNYHNNSNNNKSNNNNNNSKINNDDNNKYNNDNDNDDDDNNLKSKWISGRNVECLLFMINSLIDTIYDIDDNSKEERSISSNITNMVMKKNFLSQENVDNNNNADNHMNNNNNNNNNNNDMSLSDNNNNNNNIAYNTFQQASQIYNNKINNDSKCSTFIKYHLNNWFSNISFITKNLLEDFPMRNVLIQEHPAVTIRLLELWANIKYPKGNFMTPIPIEEIVLQILQFACMTVEMVPQGFNLGPCFDLLSSVTREFKNCISVQHSQSLVDWIITAISQQSVLIFLNKIPQKAFALYTTLGRLIMILPDNYPDEAVKTRGYYISQILNVLTTAVHLPSSLTSFLTNKLDGSCDTSISLQNEENIYILLLQCSKNLNYLKGFIRGLCEKKKSNNNDGDDEEDEIEDDDEEKGEEDMNGNNNNSSKEDENKSAIFSLILPQLCSGLFNLLETVTFLNTTIEIEKEKIIYMEYNHIQEMHSSKSKNNNNDNNNVNDITNNYDNNNDFNMKESAMKNDKINLLLTEVLTGLCSTLCSLIDTPTPCSCPLFSLLQSCEKLIMILCNIPIILHINISSYIRIATALIRQCADNCNAPQALLSNLPHICILKSLQILEKNSFFLSKSKSHVREKSSENYENVLEAFRLIRQCCVICPSLLSISISLPLSLPLSIPILNNNSMKKSENEIIQIHPPGKLFFSCFLFLLKSPPVFQNGALMRMMNTVLASFLIDSSKIKNSGSSYLTSSSPSSFPSSSFPSSSSAAASSSSSTTLFMTGYHIEYEKNIKELLSIIFYYGFFNKDQIHLRTLAGLADILVLLYRENYMKKTHNLFNLSSSLKELCCEIGLEMKRNVNMDNGNDKSNAIKCYYGNDDNININEINDINKSDSNREKNLILLIIPSVDPRPKILTSLDFMSIVYETLKYHIESEILKSSIIKECFIELCNIYRFGRKAFLAFQSAKTEKQQELVLSKVEKTSKLIIFPS